MSLLSYVELIDLVDCGVINAPIENINGVSIDVTLDYEIMVENQGVVTCKTWEKDFADMLPLDIYEHSEDGEYWMKPDEFILASTVEEFNLPSDVACFFFLKSTLARHGLEHLHAGLCDPSWHNSRLTLELKNSKRFQNLGIKAGQKIGQVVFVRVKDVPHDVGYAVRGQYNHQYRVQPSKGVR
jgi:dCTP deaminase